ncbi:hypothetical protein BDZ97DRAFT_1926597 [Flammula alnicola]|nr:hypothetical protein BDZ97DRAFT_1926597 [Flammula alnicola]
MTVQLEKVTELVKAFNALPRREVVPSELGPNEWYFDLRYVQLEPNPCHIVTLIQPQSLFVHMERLPVGLPNDCSGIAFFPETGKEAAPEVAKALLHAFVNTLGKNEVVGSRAPFAPWKLYCDDEELRAEVGEELRRLGVHPSELCQIAETTLYTCVFVEAAFMRSFEELKKSLGYTGNAAAGLLVPESISFPSFTEPDTPRAIGNVSLFDLCLKYVQEIANSRPPNPDDFDSKAMAATMRQDVLNLRQRVEEMPEAIVKAEADRGDPEAAFDYGLRLFLGVGCAHSRPLSRVYLIKALSSPSASDKLKATAHGVLLKWYSQATKDGTLRNRYMFTGAHHANVATVISRRITPRGTPPAPAVLGFLDNVCECHSPSNGLPQLHLLYKDAMKAMDEKNKRAKSERERMQQKRLKNPLRYRCATLGCGVEADTGKMLSRCSGNCDSDKKPSYCTRECQKADWKNHKPFCRPGAECSVIDDGTTSPDTVMSAGSSSKQGSGTIQIPITYADGSRMFLSSSTMDPQLLKEIRDLSINKERPRGCPSSIKFEIERVEL